MVCETNKSANKLAEKHNFPYWKVHSDRIGGLYGKSIKEMRQDAGLKKNETPLNVLSTRDLTLNSLVNQLALESDDPSLIRDIAKGISSGIEKSMKKPLEPIYETDKLQISKAKKQLDNTQLELPL